VLATLALARVVTQDLVISQNKNFGRNPSWSYVKLVITRGPTVLLFFSNQNEGKRGDTSTFLGALNCVPPPVLVDTKFYQSLKLF
jgi:hypothetical protein